MCMNKRSMGGRVRYIELYIRPGWLQGCGKEMIGPGTGMKETKKTELRVGRKRNIRN